MLLHNLTRKTGTKFPLHSSKAEEQIFTFGTFIISGLARKYQSKLVG